MRKQKKTNLVALLKKAKAGDQKSLHLLCRELEKFIRGYFEQKFQDPSLVDDLCQETYVRLLENILSIRDQMKLRSFVAKVALHVANDYLRKKYRKQKEVLQTSYAQSAQAYAGGIEESKLDLDVLNKIDLERALNHLPEKSRRILVLKSMGFNYEEISSELNISVSGVKMQVKRSIDHLKSVLFM